MWSSLWHGLFFDPIYNLLIFVAGHVPHGDVGLAIIIFTVIMKVVLLPLSLKAAHAQHKMRLVEPELARLKEIHKDNKEVYAKKSMEAYKDAGVNPVSGLFLGLVQLPILFALFFAVSRGGGVKLPMVNGALLYSFVSNPGTLSMLFLGLFDIAAKSAPLAVLAGLTQLVQAQLALPPVAEKTSDAPNFKEDLARSMQIQMKYMMPFVIGVVAYTTSAAIALYFVISNIMAIVQELIVNSRIPDRHKVIEKKTA